MPDDYYRRANPDLSPERVAERWRECFARHPLRIIHTPGRGALTAMLDSLIAALREHAVALEVIPTDNAPQVCEIVARGWAEDESDPDGFVGAFDKQAPGDDANRAYERFRTAVSSCADRGHSDRLARYGAALQALEDKWLFVPFCQDRPRLLLRD